jgi:hypothetical protein
MVRLWRTLEKKEKEVCGDTDENLAYLRSVPVTMALAGVVSLLGGIIEVC